MPEQASPSAAAIAAQQAALSTRYRSAVEADQLLAEAVRDAHAATVAAGRQIDAVAAEIDSCLQHQAAFAVDTPLGAHEFQRFLIAKHRELIAIVDEAHRDDAAKQALLVSLPTQYSAPASRS